MKKIATLALLIVSQTPTTHTTLYPHDLRCALSTVLNKHASKVTEFRNGGPKRKQAILNFLAEKPYKATGRRYGYQKTKSLLQRAL